MFILTFILLSQIKKKALFYIDICIKIYYNYMSISLGGFYIKNVPIYFYKN